MEHEFYGWFFHILGMSSSQLTFTPSFFRGVGFKPPTSYVFFCILGCPPFFVSTPQILGHDKNGDGNPWNCPGGASAGGPADRTTPTMKPRRKMEVLFLEVNVATWHHAAFSLPVRNSNFYFIFQVFEVTRWFFSEEFYFLSMPPEPENLEIVSNVHSMSITFRYFFGQSYVAWCLFSTFFQPFFQPVVKQMWDDDHDDLLTCSFQTPQPSDDGASPKAAPTDHLGTLQPAAPWVSRGWGFSRSSWIGQM